MNVETHSINPETGQNIKVSNGHLNVTDQEVFMRAELKGISSDEVDIHSYVPDDPECFLITLRLRIGPEGAGGGDDFEIFVCTPTWLENNVWEPMWGRHFLIVKEFHYQLIIDTIIKGISQYEGVSWSDIACKLARFYASEFEDYQA